MYLLCDVKWVEWKIFALVDPLHAVGYSLLSHNQRILYTVGVKRAALQELVADLSWLRDNCIHQLEAAEFFENHELMSLNRGAAVAYQEAVSRLRDVLQRVDRMDFETVHYPLLTG